MVSVAGTQLCHIAKSAISNTLMNAYTVFNEAIYRKAADVIYLPEMNPDYPCFSSPRVTYAESFI